jgi:hypothetical protein
LECAGFDERARVMRRHLDLMVEVFGELLPRFCPPPLGYDAKHLQAEACQP